MIRVNQIVPKHTVDKVPLIRIEMFLTSTHELLVMGICPRCREQVSFTIPLEELQANCPAAPGFTVKDISDLAQMKIRLPEGDDT